MGNKIKVAISGACGKMGQAVVKAVQAEEDLEFVSAIDVVNIGKDIGEIVENKPCGVIIKNSLENALQNKEINSGTQSFQRLHKKGDDYHQEIDVVVDFTNPDLVYKHTKMILESNVRPVIGTTGLTEEQLQELKKLSDQKGIGCLIAPNFAVGAVLMMMFAQKASKYFNNAEIIELHHNKKKDAPSGTALKTAELMTREKSEFAQDNCAETETLKGSRGGVTKSNLHIHSVRMPGFIASQEVICGSAGQVLTIRHDSFDRISFMPGVVLGIRHVMVNNEFVYGLENIL